MAKMSDGNKLKVNLNKSVDSISWQKESLYSVYPETHIDRENGTAYRIKNNDIHPFLYGEAPKCIWEDDTENYFLNKKDSKENLVCSRGFKAMRTRVNWFTAEIDKSDILRIRMNSKNSAVQMLAEYDKNDIISISKAHIFLIWSGGIITAKKELLV